MLEHMYNFLFQVQAVQYSCMTGHHSLSLWYLQTRIIIARTTKLSVLSRENITFDDNVIVSERKKPPKSASSQGL